MFRQTLGGARYVKDPTEIHGIKGRQNDGLQAFMDRFKFESSHIKGVPQVLRISAFMHGHGHPELAKKLNDKIPKTVDEMGHNTNDFYQLKKQIEEVVASGKLAHLVKDIRRNNQRNGSQGRNNVKVINVIRNQLMDEPIILKGTIEDYQVRRILVDGGSSSEIMRNVPPSRNNRPSSNHGKGRKKQNCANGICNSKMPLAVQRHNRKDQNEEPRSGWLYHPFYD
ncbi:hypothetical protein Tco_0336297 [Tanacetum coccineum]